MYNYTFFCIIMQNQKTKTAKLKTAKSKTAIRR